MSRQYLKVAIVIAIVLIVALAAPALAKGPPVSEVTNNLSFPAIAADGSTIVDKTESFLVPYTGDYPGLTAEEIAILEATGPWYAQKVTGNAWNAEFDTLTNDESVTVYGVDWGDNIESVSPAVGRPYRLETGLYALPSESMQGYTMVMLGYPSSPDEIQGTKADAVYDSDYATITSTLPGLSIQRIEGLDVATLSWDDAQEYWVTPDGAIAGDVTAISFGPELNVAGKYIFGASTGGWKPLEQGKYRITFYIPGLSQIEMDATTSIGNLVSGAWVPGLAGEGGAEPQLLADENLTYVDVTVIRKGGGGKH